MVDYSIASYVFLVDMDSNYIYRSLYLYVFDGT